MAVSEKTRSMISFAAYHLLASHAAKRSPPLITLHAEECGWGRHPNDDRRRQLSEEGEQQLAAILSALTRH